MIVVSVLHRRVHAHDGHMYCPRWPSRVLVGQQNNIRSISLRYIINARQCYSMRWTTYATQPASIFPNGYPTLPCEVPAKRELSLENKRRVILSSTGTKLIAAKRREMQDAIQVSRTIINRVIEVI